MTVRERVGALAPRDLAAPSGTDHRLAVAASFTGLVDEGALDLPLPGGMGPKFALKPVEPR